MLLTRSEVARLLRVSGRTINRYVEDGKLKAIHVGNQKRLLFPIEQFKDVPGMDELAARIEQEALAAEVRAREMRRERERNGARTRRTLR